MDEEIYSIAEIAKILKVSTDKVVRLFQDEPGVINLGAPEKLHKRRYRILRIPASVMHRVLQQRRIK